jgi:hypothetical protein
VNFDSEELREAVIFGEEVSWWATRLSLGASQTFVRTLATIGLKVQVDQSPFFKGRERYFRQDPSQRCAEVDYPRPE